ncbi:MAG TPA: hypothetical protein VFQ95_04020 [Rhodanobacteraceae bacterium]|nr:hypothetical protein [Rhodanobacteraceae bacterium]
MFEHAANEKGLSDRSALAFEAMALVVVVVAWTFIPRRGLWNALTLVADLSALVLAWAGIVVVSGGVRRWLGAVNRTPRQIYLDFRNGNRGRLTLAGASCCALALLVFVITVVI